MTSTQSSGTSSATGTSDQTGAASHDVGQDRDRQRHAGRHARLHAGPCGVSTLWKTGPSGSATREDVDAGVAQHVELVRGRRRASTPTTAAVRSPSRAVVNAA